MPMPAKDILKEMMTLDNEYGYGARLYCHSNELAEVFLYECYEIIQKEPNAAGYTFGAVNIFLIFCYFSDFRRVDRNEKCRIKLEFREKYFNHDETEDPANM